MTFSEETKFVPLRDILRNSDWQSPAVMQKLFLRGKLGKELYGILEAGDADPDTLEIVQRALYVAAVATRRDSDSVAFDVEPAVFTLLFSDVLGERARAVYLDLVKAAPDFHLLDAMAERLVPSILDPQTSPLCRDRCLSLLMPVLERNAVAVDNLERLVVDTDKTNFGARIKWWFAQKFPMVLRHCYAKHSISHVPMPSIEVLVSTDDADKNDAVLYGEFAAAAETTNPSEILRVLENAWNYSTSEVFVAIFLSLTTLKHPEVSSDRVLRALETARSDPRRAEAAAALPRTLGEQAEAAVSWWWQYSESTLKSDAYIPPGYVCTYPGAEHPKPEKKPPKRKQQQTPRTEAVSFEFRWWRHFLLGDVCPDCGLSDVGADAACKSEYHRGDSL